jgi:hypothetical protein
LQAFFDRIAFQNAHRPPASRDFLNVYMTARNPPPVVTLPKNRPITLLHGQVDDLRRRWITLLEEGKKGHAIPKICLVNRTCDTLQVSS